MFIPCTRCKSTDATEFSSLIGGVPAYLCLVCMNEWDDVAQTSPLMESEIGLRASKLALDSKAAAGQAPTLSECTMLERDAHDLQMRWRTLAREFLSRRPS